jgi:thioredoxin reductase (NADPH)
MNNKYDLLIIGGGPVGIFCAFLAHNKGLKPLIIEANSSFGGQPNILYSQKEVHDYPGFKSIKAYEIFNMLLQQFNSVKIDNFVNTTLKQCNFFNKSFNIELSNEKKVNASNIVLACGNGIFNPNKLEIKTNNKIHYIVKPFEFYKNKKVIILGGGDSAVD